MIARPPFRHTSTVERWRGKQFFCRKKNLTEPALNRCADRALFNSRLDHPVGNYTFIRFQLFFYTTTRLSARSTYFLILLHSKSFSYLYQTSLGVSLRCWDGWGIIYTDDDEAEPTGQSQSKRRRKQRRKKKEKNEKERKKEKIFQL